MLNPIELYKISNEVNNLKGNKVLGGWEGFSVYTNKEPLEPDQYQAYFIRHLYNKLPTVIKKNIHSTEDYKNLIMNSVPDIIVYDNNPMNFDGIDVDNITNKNYNIVYQDKSVRIYQNKGLN